MANENLNPVLGKRLSAEDIKAMANWPDELIEDYLEMSEIVTGTSTLPQQYAGNPNNNVTSNRSRMCVDTNNDYLYYNPDVGVKTGWVKIVV